MIGTQQPWVCPPYICAFCAPPARAEPVVSACVLEKSLEIHSKYSGGHITAAEAIYVLGAGRDVKRW